MLNKIKLISLPQLIDYLSLQELGEVTYLFEDSNNYKQNNYFIKYHIREEYAIAINPDLVEIYNYILNIIKPYFLYNCSMKLKDIYYQDKDTIINFLQENIEKDDKIEINSTLLDKILSDICFYNEDLIKKSKITKIMGILYHFYNYVKVFYINKNSLDNDSNNIESIHPIYSMLINNNLSKLNKIQRYESNLKLQEWLPNLELDKGLISIYPFKLYPKNHKIMSEYFYFSLTSENAYKDYILINDHHTIKSVLNDIIDKIIFNFK